MAADLIADLSIELFWASAVVDIWVAGLKRAVRQGVEVSEGNTS